MAELATDLTGALDRGEIEAWFQPQLDLHGGGIVGAEALCRWHHPQLGILSPDTFIPLAEELGHIHGIGQFMAEQCWEAIDHWRQLGHQLDLSVNVSPLQLQDSSFTDWLRGRVSFSGAGRLTIEITESLPLEDVPALVPRLDELRSMGFGIAIDDFGVGQASLTQLRRLHGTELKIDRTLIVDASAETTERLIRVVDYARSTGIRVVAEGVETYDQLARVRELGCDRAQGYLIARPMPRSEVDALLAS